MRSTSQISRIVAMERRQVARLVARLPAETDPDEAAQANLLHMRDGLSPGSALA